MTLKEKVRLGLPIPADEASMQQICECIDELLAEGTTTTKGRGPAGGQVTLLTESHSTSTPTEPRRFTNDEYRELVECLATGRSIRHLVPPAPLHEAREPVIPADAYDKMRRALTGEPEPIVLPPGIHERLARALCR